MPKLELDKAASDHLSRLLAKHLQETFDLDVDPFDAVALLDFLAKTLGPYYYNQAVADAQAVLKDRVEQIIEAVEAIELPLPR